MANLAKSDMKALNRMFINELNEIYGENGYRLIMDRDYGYSILILPAIAKAKNPKSFHAYIAYCSENDKFKKRIGLNILHNRYENDQYLVIPPDWVQADKAMTEILDTLSSWDW